MAPSQTLTDERGQPTDGNDFCSGMERELTAWEAKLCDTGRKFDQLGTAEREDIQSKIEELHIGLEESSGRIEDLKTECPTDWRPMKKEIEDAQVDMRGIYEEPWKPLVRHPPFRYPDDRATDRSLIRRQ